MLRTFLDRIRVKITDSRGESLIEVLAAIVISGLSILMLATTVAAAVRVNTSSETIMNRYYDASNDLAATRGTSHTTGTVTMKVKDENTIITFGNVTSINITYYYSTDIGGTVVASYEE